MEQRESIRSPFQMRDWRIIHLNYNNPILALNPEADVQWEIEVNKEFEHAEDQDFYTGTIRLEFTASIPQENRTMSLSGLMISLFTYDGGKSDENDRSMNQMLQMNGLAYCFGMLRNFISSQSDILGLRKRLIFPSINLYNIRFDEKISL